jgi:two-component system nitrate/nitrite response regulator NarL
MVVDDHLGVAQALAHALGSSGEVCVVGCAATPWEARDLLALGVEVALLDLQLGSHDGLALARELVQREPQLRLIVMTDAPDPAVLESVIALGARGYVNKTQGLAHLVDTVRGARADHIAIPVQLFEAVFNGSLHPTERGRDASQELRALLTERELEVLSLMAEGLTTKELASHLVVSVNTVRSHTQNTLTKLGVKNRLQAVAKARAAGLFSGPAAALPGPLAVAERRRS